VGQIPEPDAIIKPILFIIPDLHEESEKFRNFFLVRKKELEYMS
jgi:hypothetical protein